jgi:hypothetical protein
MADDVKAATGKLETELNYGGDTTASTSESAPTAPAVEDVPDDDLPF